LEHGQHDALLGPDLWAADLTSENADLLAKYEEFDVLGLGGSAGQQDEPEELPAELSCQANDHRNSLLG
jgi:hypothetical protein